MVDKWDAIGIEPGSRFLDLYYEPLSEKFIAHFFKDLGYGYGIKTLYVRHVSEDTYRKLEDTDGSLSFEDLVISPERPEIYVNVFRFSKAGGSYGYVWDSIKRIDLDTGQISPVRGDQELLHAAHMLGIGTEPHAMFATEHSPYMTQ